MRSSRLRIVKGEQPHNGRSLLLLLLGDLLMVTMMLLLEKEREKEKVTKIPRGEGNTGSIKSALALPKESGLLYSSSLALADL